MDKADCTGCGTCALKCPKKALSMQMDEEGFYYPIVDETKCVHCGICEKVCHLNCFFEKPKKQILFAGVNKNKSVLMQSSSGGIFSAIAEKIINKNGCVFAVINDSNNIAYAKGNTVESIEMFRGSKYVQAKSHGIFQEVEKSCKSGINTLFVGTPCQIAGLKCFLEQDFKNLITVDIICHGTPSELFYNEYLRYLENRLKGSVTEFKFRDKSSYGLSCISSCKVGRYKRKKILTNQLNNYYYFYMFGDSYRYSCYTCHYANLHRIADITLGDFWGIEKTKSKLFTDNGCSAVIANTDKGLSLISELKECEFEKHTISSITAQNMALSRATKMPETRHNIYSDLKSWGFIYLVKTRYKVKPIKYIAGVMKAFLPLNIVRVIKKYCK